MTTDPSFQDLDQRTQVACFLSLLAMSAIDREMHPKEMQYILNLALSESGIAERVQMEFARFRQHPVTLRSHLLELRELPRNLKSKVFLSLVDVVLADEEVRFEEAKALLLGAKLLRLMNAFHEMDKAIGERVRQLRDLASDSTEPTRRIVDEVLELVLRTPSARVGSEVPREKDSPLDRLLDALRDSKARARRLELMAELIKS
ncbi:MAG TPA: hypothetical protein VLV83_27225 [Acidobacteriota bacterium]|nr:hypothetical protein [Acidobacteriota bacterium]